MTEYWKSLPKKYCDLCKCWFTDNKASVDFHERGTRHKANVQERIRDAQKKGKTTETAKTSYDVDMKKIEAAAMLAFEKDVCADPSLASRYGSVTTTSASATAGTAKSQPAAKSASKVANPAAMPTTSYASLLSLSSSSSSVTPKDSQKLAIGHERAMDTITAFQKKQVEATAAKKWKEAKSDDGYSFFTHFETDEVRWDAPPEGFVSLAEQLESVGKASEDDFVPSLRTKPLLPAFGAALSLGGWTSVEPNRLPDVDFNVPEKANDTEFVDNLYNTAIEQEYAPLEFKTKTVKSLGADDGRDTSFKKRKPPTDSIRRQVKKREE